MVIPEGSAGFCLVLRVFEAHSIEELADRVIVEPGFVGLDIKQMVHLTPLLPDEACIRNKTFASL